MVPFFGGFLALIINISSCVAHSFASEEHSTGHTVISRNRLIVENCEQNAYMSPNHSLQCTSVADLYRARACCKFNYLLLRLSFSSGCFELACEEGDVTSTRHANPILEQCSRLFISPFLSPVRVAREHCEMTDHPL